MNKHELIKILKKQHDTYRKRLNEKIEYYGCHVISIDEYDFSFPEEDDVEDTSTTPEENLPFEEYDYSFPDDDKPSPIPEPVKKETPRKNTQELINKIALLRGGPLPGDYFKRPKKN